MQLGWQNRCEWCRIRVLLFFTGTGSSTMAKAVGDLKRVLLCVWGGPKWASGQQGLTLGGKAGCQVGRNKGKLESTRTNSNLPVYPLFHPQPCGWLAGRSWQPLPPSYTGSWPRPHKIGGRWGNRDPAAAPGHRGSWQISSHMGSYIWCPILTLWE